MDERTLQIRTKDYPASLLVTRGNMLRFEWRWYASKNWLPNSRTTTFHRCTRRRYTQRSSQQVDASIWNASRSRSVENRSEAKTSVQPSQRKIEEYDPQHGERGVLRNVWIYPKIRCLYCLTYWTKGIVCCTCGTCLYLTEKLRKMIRDRFDTLSTPHNVIKNGPLHGARHGNTEGQRIYHAVYTAATKANAKGYDTMLERFQNCPIYRESQLATIWDEALGAH